MDLITDSRGYQFLFEEEAREAGFGYGSPRLHLGKIVTKVKWAPAGMTAEQ
jgi:hypothetical protein